jgi:pentatricopeptide repeat protein
LVVTACERSGQWKKALAILEGMRRRDCNFYANTFLDALFKRLVMAWSSATAASDDETGARAKT